MVINPMAFGANPEEFVLMLLQQQFGGTPMGNNIIELAKRNDINGLENIARNLMAQQGRNYDVEFSKFKNSLGIK